VTVCACVSFDYRPIPVPPAIPGLWLVVWRFVASILHVVHAASLQRSRERRRHETREAPKNKNPETPGIMISHVRLPQHKAIRGNTPHCYSQVHRYLYYCRSAYNAIYNAPVRFLHAELRVALAAGAHATVDSLAVRGAARAGLPGEGSAVRA
jgi:hypothetical protein